MKNKIYKNKYHDLIQQDFRIEHLIFILKIIDLELLKIKENFQQLEKIKKLYIEKSNKNRNSKYDVYQELLKIIPFDSQLYIDVLKLKNEYNNILTTLEKIIIDYNIMLNFDEKQKQKYLSKISLNHRKLDYVTTFVNALFKYFIKKDEQYYSNNISNLQLLLKKYINKFPSFDLLIKEYKNEQNINCFNNIKTDLTILKSKSVYTRISEYILK
jgi:hypothetical protein